LKNIIFFSILLIAINAHAAVTIHKTVPFNNVKMHKNDTIIADYNFGKGDCDNPTFREIFCYDPSLTNVGHATWTYHNQVITMNLPVLLKTCPQYSGDFADKTGTITIVDTKENDENGDVIFMSCNFF